MQKSWQTIDTLALILIMEYALPPRGLFIPWLTDGPKAPWRRALRHHKGLTLVCKHWSAIALSLLYRDICFLRVGQVFAFADLIRSDRGVMLASLVRSITFKCEIPKSVERTFISNATAILKGAPISRLWRWGLYTRII